MEINCINELISKCYDVYSNFTWLVDSYVLDYFTESHWKKLPKTWRNSLEKMEPHEIAQFLNYDLKMSGKCLPLSLLALRECLKTYALKRTMTDLNMKNPSFAIEDKNQNLFWKGVKAKKLHEISLMSKMCYKSALETDCFYIVDIGSGLGHLSRILHYGYGFKVCTIEAQTVLSQRAKILDQQFEKALKIYSNNRIVHITKRLDSTLTYYDFLTIVKNAFNVTSTKFKFGLVGLHPCGNLASILLKLFNDGLNIQFINIVGCCYMKLTTMPEAVPGFPLSQYSKDLELHLSYHSREIACHAIENYIEKLEKGDYWRLKIHTYRAVLEQIFSEKYPNYVHNFLSNVKFTEDLSFEKYCEKATSKLKIDLSALNLNTTEIDHLLLQWKEVVIFYSLRLLFAPLMESIIHLDRLSYVLESGNVGEILSVFDARISPRTHVLTARKGISTAGKSSMLL